MQFGEDVGQVVADSFRGERQVGGDVAGCLPGEHRQDLALALGEFGQRGALGWRCGEVGQDPVGDLGPEHRFAAGHGADRGDKFGLVGALEHVTARAGA